MGKFEVILKPQAERDIAVLEKSGNKATLKKIKKIFLELSEHPSKGIGRPELLKHELSGYWSRRLNSKDRLIYEIIEEPHRKVVVVSALGHYE